MGNRCTSSRCLLFLAIVLCVCVPSFATITFSNNTLTYSSPSDLGTTIDPSGQKDVTNSYGITKASFQALNPQVVAFNGAPTPSQTLRTLVVNYTASSTVTFTFPSAMYNYGSMTSVGRGSFSGSSAQDAISTVPTTPDSLNDWFDATITSTGGRGVQSLGFCAAFRNDQAVPAGQVLFTLSDSTTGSVTLPTLGGSGNPEYIFIGYTAPSGKTITRVQASRTSSAGGGWVSVDDLSFVMSPASDTTAPAAVSNLSSSGATASSVTLTWTAPGDDGSTGTATTYDIRYSTSTITAGNWSSAAQVSGEPAPQVAGTNQSMTVSGLSADTTYYFAMETADEVPNWSALSNVYSQKTSDTVAPAAVSNLATSSPTTSSMVLSWTAPGDNGSTGTATTYDIRYSTSAITAGNWASATQVTGEPAPAAAGTNQNMTIPGLSADTTYYFAIETADEVPNWSAISNSPSGKTSDTTAPAAVSNLATGSPTNNSITLTWTAPGDNGSAGTATTYDIRYSTSTITAGNWASATQVTGEPTPLAAGNNQSMTITGLAASTTYYFAIETADEVPNWSALSNVPSGTTTGGTITFANNTLTYGSPSDLGTTIDPAGLNDVATSYGVSKASFQALNPQVVGFNGAPAPSQTLRTLVAYYNPTNTVTFTFPSAMYNYGSMTSLGRGAFSGASPQDAISTVPTQPDSLYDWFDATITSTGGQGVKALGFCAGFRNDQAVSAGQVLYTLSDATTNTVTLPALGGAGNPQYVFIGYQAPAGKTITRVQASRTSGAGGGYVAVDDLAFVMGTADTTAPAAVSNLATSSPTASSITLSWTAPGDDGSTGTATTYDIRYSTSAITAGNWASATQVTGEPAPAAAGTNQNMTITGLSADTTYYFAIETADEVPNWSAISNSPSGKTSDTVAPAAVSNLATSSPTSSSITLTWTAPGDNGSSGTATTYDIRYSTSTITAGNWASATQVTGEPTPLAAGNNQSFVVTGLSAGTTYYFAMKTADEVPNWSALSNVPSGATTAAGDTTAPAAVSNLAAGNATNTSIRLTWTAPGDDGSTGTATTYDIRYSTSTITTGNFSSATQVSGEPTPLVAGSNQSMTVGGLSPNTTYYFAMKTADEVPNWSTISNVPSATTTNTSGNNKPILGQSDFVYQGYYIVQRGGYSAPELAELNYGQGFTHRYVSGQLRFLVYSFFGNVQGGGDHLVEFAPPAGGYGSTVTARTNHWADIFGSTGMAFGNGCWGGLWYEQAQERLWTTWAIDYPDDVQDMWTKTFVVRTLNADGTVSNVQGPWGLQGIGNRRIYGGVVPIPSWFQSTYGVPAYGAGWGGYSSRMAQGLSAALSPTFYAFPEPTGYPAGDIPTSAFKILMEPGNGIYGADWYPNGSPTSFDRGVRNTDVTNDYDTPYWQSPAPDGLGRYTWGDSNWNTGCWIETPTKQGFILVPKFCNGRTWYETSTLHCERQSEEIQVFDPNMLGQVAQGTRAVWDTKPTNRWEITSTLTPLGFNWARSGNGPDGGAAGASYDSTTQTLYIYCIGGNNWNSYILVYHVN